MTITLTVSEVRQALQQAAGRAPSGDGAPSTALRDDLHRVIGELLRDDWLVTSSPSCETLSQIFGEWQRVMVEHTYDQLLGPMLTNHSASLREHGDQVLDLWTAVQDAIHWLAELWWQITEKGTKWASQSDSFWVERQVVLDLQQPDLVGTCGGLLGQTDAVLRHPTTNAWCVLEWKIGQTSPVIDLAQVCLYHLMLNGLNPAKTNSAIAVVSFLPGRHETLFQNTQIADAQAKLLDLIGRTAGVIGQCGTQKTEITTVVGRTEGGSSGPTTVSPPRTIDRPSVQKPERTSDPSSEWLIETRDKMLRALRRFGASCREIKPPAIGPTFVRFFPFLPESGIRRNKVLTAASELQLHLGLASEPVLSTVEGAIAVDLANPNRRGVPFSEFIPQLPAVDPLLGCSKVPVGLNLTGELVWCDLAVVSPHLLVVGTPGSGKSQWLRCPWLLGQDEYTRNSSVAAD